MPRKTRTEIIRVKAQRPKARFDVMPSKTHGKAGKAARRHDRRSNKQKGYDHDA